MKFFILLTSHVVHIYQIIIIMFWKTSCIYISHLDFISFFLVYLFLLPNVDFHFKPLFSLFITCRTILFRFTFSCVKLKRIICQDLCSTAFWMIGCAYFTLYNFNFHSISSFHTHIPDVIQMDLNVNSVEFFTRFDKQGILWVCQR